MASAEATLELSQPSLIYAAAAMADSLPDPPGVRPCRPDTILNVSTSPIARRMRLLETAPALSTAQNRSVQPKSTVSRVDMVQRVMARHAYRVVATKPLSRREALAELGTLPASCHRCRRCDYLSIASAAGVRSS